MSSISSVAAGAGAAIITNNSGSSASGKPGQAVEPTGSASSTVPLLYYTSPRIFVDPQYGQVVYDYRDPTTGISTQQVPSKQALSAYTKTSQTLQPAATATASVASTASPAPVPTSTSATASAPSSAPAPAAAPVSTGAGTSTLV